MYKFIKPAAFLTPEQAKQRLDEDVAAAHRRYEERLAKFKQLEAELARPQEFTAADLRAFRAAELRHAGMPYRKIGEQMGISTARARQLALKADRIKKTHADRDGLSVRAYNVLRGHGIVCRGQKLNPEAVATLSMSGLLEIGNCGNKTVAEVTTWLKTKGFDLIP